MREAYELARSQSQDLSTHNAALLVSDGVVVASGVNRLPTGVAHSCDRLSLRPAKYLYVEHAERNAVYDAARRGVMTEGLVMYCPWFACADCARAIVESGVREVVGHKFEGAEGYGSWKDSIEAGLQMLKEANVAVRYLEGAVGVDGLLFNGQRVSR